MNVRQATILCQLANPSSCAQLPNSVKIKFLRISSLRAGMSSGTTVASRTQLFFSRYTFPGFLKSSTTCGRGLALPVPRPLHWKPLPHWGGVSAVWRGADGCSRSAAPLSPPPRCRPPPLPRPRPRPRPPPASRYSPARPSAAPPEGPDTVRSPVSQEPLPPFRVVLMLVVTDEQLVQLFHLTAMNWVWIPPQ